jgi:hypothetical protein
MTTQQRLNRLERLLPAPADTAVTADLSLLTDDELDELAGYSRRVRGAVHAEAVLMRFTPEERMRIAELREKVTPAPSGAGPAQEA